MTSRNIASGSRVDEMSLPQSKRNDCCLCVNLVINQMNPGTHLMRKKNRAVV